MDLNDLFITLVLVNCVWLLAMQPARVWMIKTTAVLALLGGTWWWWPDRTGWYTVGPWAVLILVPMWLQHWSYQLMQQRKLGLARWTSAVFAVLQPTASARRLQRMVQVLNHLQRGEIATGRQLAEQSGFHDSGLRNLCLVTEAQLSGDWPAFEHQLDSLPHQGLTDPSLIAGKIQALAERGAWEELHRASLLISQSHFSPEQNAALSLRVFALLGDLNTIQNLFLCNGHLIARETREFWLAVAEQASGDTGRAQQRLTQLLPRSSLALRPMIERRLALPAVSPSDDAVRNRGLQELISVRSIIDHDAHYAVLSGRGRRWPVITLLLSLAIIAMYVREIPGGSEDVDNLVRLGALELPLEGAALKWKALAQRVLASGFLHFGPIHLSLNLLGLLFLGRMFERASGPFWMLVHYLACVMVSGCLLPWLTFLAEHETAVFAGASGGIMGLLGGLWGVLLVGRLSEGTPLVRGQFRSACSFIVLQSVCDMLTPKVSMTCHLLGLLTGILGGVLLGLRGGRR